MATKNTQQMLANFDHHADGAVGYKWHLPMEHIPGFTRSHWLLPLGECLRCIAPAAAMVSVFVETT